MDATQTTTGLEPLNPGTPVRVPGNLLRVGKAAYATAAGGTTLVRDRARVFTTQDNLGAVLADYRSRFPDLDVRYVAGPDAEIVVDLEAETDEE